MFFQLCNLHFFFREHTSFVHEKKKIYECTTCKEEFPKQLDLSRHISTKHRETKIHKCPVCEKAFSALKLMEKHRKKLHKKSLVCQMCKRSFKAEASYDKHIKICEGKIVKQKVPQVSKHCFQKSLKTRLKILLGPMVP